MVRRQQADPEARAALVRLVGEVADGDRRALKGLYDQTSAKLFGIILSVVPIRPEAEEVLQDVFVTVWEKADNFDPSRGSPITWLATIARNRAIDRRRAMQGAGEAVHEDALASVPHDAPSALQALEDAQDRERLFGCLQALELHMRTAVSEAFLMGHTYEELAQRHAVPLGTMKSWIRRALIRLRVCLES